MKKINSLLFLVLALTMSVSSCKKDQSTPSKVLTTKESNTKIIIAVPWKVSSQVKYDAPFAVQNCEKDDIYTFFSDGTFSLNVGSLICDVETNSSGTWILNADGTGVLKFGSTLMSILINSRTQVVLTDSNLDGITNQLNLMPQ